MPVRKCVASSLLFGFSVAAAPHSRVSAETWTDLRGSKSIEAKMVGQWEDNVVLELTNGRRVTAKLESLRSDSRIQAQNLAAKLSERRQSSIEKIRKQADLAGAPAPIPLPQPEPAPPYSPPVTGRSAQDAFEHAMQQYSNGHVRVLLDSLPPKQRQDIDDIAMKALELVDERDFNTVTETLHRIGDLIVTRQNWVFSHPRFLALPDQQREEIQTGILNVAGFLRDGFAPETTNMQQIKSSSLQDWLAEFDAKTAAHLAPMMQEANSRQADMVMKFTKGKKGETTFEIGQDEKSLAKVALTQVDGFWFPSDALKDWDKGIAEAKSKIEESKETMSAGGMVAAVVPAMVNPYLQPLQNAKDAKSFHIAMESVIDQLGKLPALAAAALPKGMTSSFTGGSSSSSGGYGGEYGDDEYGSGYGGDEGMDEGYGDDYGDGYGG